MTPTDPGSTRDGRKRRWAKHNTDRRRHIISAAMAVLARDIAPGERMTAQQIADGAGLHRTGLYRFFDDRADLDTSIQLAICEGMRIAFTGAVTLTGTPRELVHRVVTVYVGWVADHPEWARFIEQDIPGATVNPLEETSRALSEQLEVVTATFLALVDADVSDDERKLVGPWVSGLIFGTMGAVRSWQRQGENRADLERFTTFLADTVWLQITGLGVSRGIHIPRVPLEKMIDGLAASTGPTPG